EARDVSAIVDDDLRAAAMGGAHDGGRRVEQLGPGHRLGSKLEKPCAAVEERVGQIEELPAGSRRGIGVDDGAQRVRSRYTASARRPPLVLGRARKRSMNEVLSLPATNSGSASTRRCSGIVVLIPSTTVISSVRFIRAIASARSRPWTMILAIIES